MNWERPIPLGVGEDGAVVALTNAALAHTHIFAGPENIRKELEKWLPSKRRRE